MQGRHKGRGGAFSPGAAALGTNFTPNCKPFFFRGWGGGVGALGGCHLPRANPGRDDLACMYEEYILN